MKREAYNLDQILFTANLKKIDHFKILERAYNLNMLDVDDNEKDLLYRFINSIKEKGKFIKSQLYQDVFADFLISNNHEKTFFEFGATDGLDLSNTHLLENFSNWSGLLAEPDPQWHSKLETNRPNVKIVKKCIWKKTGEKINFLSSNNGALSTIEDFRYNDKESIPGNSNLRNLNVKNFSVETISLNDAIKKYFSNTPSYISIDTEGSEFEILKSFNFSKFKPVFFTIEHNFTINQKNIDELMYQNGYVRIFRKITSFDGWYVKKEVIT